MRNALKPCLAIGALFAVGCTTTAPADPTTFAHLSCEKLRGLYDPTSELLIPNIAKEHPGDSNYDRAQPDRREWKYEKEDREERTQFRADVRAAYKANGCSTSTSATSSFKNIDKTDFAKRLATANMSLETVEKQVQAEIAYQRDLYNLP